MQEWKFSWSNNNNNIIQYQPSCELFCCMLRWQAWYLLIPSYKFTTLIFPLSYTLNSCSLAGTTLKNLPLYCFYQVFPNIFSDDCVLCTIIRHLSWNIFINLILIFSRRVKIGIPLTVQNHWLKLSVMLFVTWSLFTARSKTCLAHKCNGSSIN